MGIVNFPEPVAPSAASCRHLSYDPEAVALVDEAIALSGPDLDPRMVELFRQAAAKGHPYAQYRYAVICHYEFGDRDQAWKLFQASAEHYHDAKRHLAMYLEEGYAKLPKASKNPEIAARQRLEAAARLYREAAEAGNYKAAHRLGLMLLQGRGAVRDYRQALKWITRSACQGHHPAQDCLARLLLDPARAGHDPLTAYVWMVMAWSEDNRDLLASLESALSVQEIVAAQSEAQRLSGLIKANGSLTAEDLDQLRANLAAARTPGSSKPAPQATAALEAKLRAWEPSSFAALTFHIRPRAKAVQIVFGRKKARLSFADFARLFSPYALPLLVDHFKALNSTEPPVDYHSASLARAVNANYTRPNHKLVSEVNSRLRAVFGISAREEKAFAWIHGSDRRQKSLKARIKIMVHYLD
ncbi:MAG: tetratricopeptide repeat protein [Candidatus Cloacimonetes bacterium]|nr:tetratricopeptide repeat protein [Candidatus Cloacimonadota bacterium]